MKAQIYMIIYFPQRNEWLTREEYRFKGLVLNKVIYYKSTLYTEPQYQVYIEAIDTISAFTNGVGLIKEKISENNN